MEDETSEMGVELSKAPAPETPASVMCSSISEYVTSIMMLCGGIESISATKYVSGFGNKLHVTIAPFNGAPKEVVEQGIIIKDALAQIMSVMNITRIIAKPSDSDLKQLRKAWNNAVRDSKSMNGGSAQAFASESSNSSEV